MEEAKKEEETEGLEKKENREGQGKKNLPKKDKRTTEKRKGKLVKHD